MSATAAHSSLPAPSTPAAPQLLPLLRGARVGRHARLGCSPLLSLGAFVLVQLFGGIADEHGRAEPGRGDTRVARSAARERQQRDACLRGLQVHAAQRDLYARVGRVGAPARRSAQLDANVHVAGGGRLVLPRALPRFPPAP